MVAIAVGSIVSYQGRCWLVTRAAGAWLHIITALGPSTYKGVDVPSSQVSFDLRSSESGQAEMFCPFKRNQVQSYVSK
jgi:hypothetical protein